MNDCTTTDCGNLTDAYLCGHCVRDLQQWIEKAWRLLPDLRVSIEKLDVVRKQGQEGGAGGKAGSNAPLSLDALQLRENLGSIDRSATEYAKDQFAAGIAWTIADWVTKAERIISGPEDDAPTQVEAQAMRERINMALPDHLGTTEAIDWLKSFHRIHVKPATIRQWASRGHINRTNTEGRPRYDPAELLLQARRDVLAFGGEVV